MSGEGAGPARGTLSLIHHHPGRLRVRADVFRSGDAASRARAALDAMPGITDVTHSPRTGSLLIEYEAGLADPETILSDIAAAADIDPPSGDPRPRGREPSLVAIDAAREVNELVHEMTGFRADLRTLVPAGLAALAAYSFAFHEDDRLPRWDNLLYWSYNVFSALHRREIEGVRRALATAPRPAEPGPVESPSPTSSPPAKPGP
jgi:hypothetical protein